VSVAVVIFAVAAFIGFLWFAIGRELVNRDARSLEESRGVLVSGLRARQLDREISEKQVQL
jgi:hypothetical protein